MESMKQLVLNQMIDLAKKNAKLDAELVFMGAVRDDLLRKLTDSSGAGHELRADHTKLVAEIERLKTEVGCLRGIVDDVRKAGSLVFERAGEVVDASWKKSPGAIKQRRAAMSRLTAALAETRGLLDIPL